MQEEPATTSTTALSAVATERMITSETGETDAEHDSEHDADETCEFCENTHVYVL